MTQEPENPNPYLNSSVIEEIGDAMRRMRVLTGRRMIGRQALKRMDNGLELSHLDVISVARRGEDVTIGMVADEMRIDPSRASRIVGELVAQGVLERRVSQNDARRSIIELTGIGRMIVATAEATKRDILHEVMGGWSGEDIENFARLYQAFTAGLENCLKAAEDDTNPPAAASL
jgi:DNA-binding MarR family transcriptional regulator